VVLLQTSRLAGISGLRVSHRRRERSKWKTLVTRTLDPQPLKCTLNANSTLYWAYDADRDQRPEPSAGVMHAYMHPP
jgi:hypothetical protein